MISDGRVITVAPSRGKIYIRTPLKTTVSSGFWNFPPFFPTCLARRKEREISKPGKNRGLESCSNIVFPLAVYFLAFKFLWLMLYSNFFHDIQVLLYKYLFFMYSLFDLSLNKAWQTLIQICREEKIEIGYLNMGLKKS